MGDDAVSVWTIEQANGGNSSPALAFPSNVKAGSLLIGVCGGDDTTSPVNTPTDTRGNSWTLIRNQDDATNGIRAVWWYAIANGAGADTVTFTNMGAFDFYQCLEVSVDSGTIEIDESGGTPKQNGQAANHTNAANNISSGNITPTVNDAFILGFACEDGADNTYSAGTNYSLIAAANTNLNGIALAPVRLEQQTLASPAAVAATFTGNASGRAIAMVAAFRAVGGATPTGIAWIKG